MPLLFTTREIAVGCLHAAYSLAPASVTARLRLPETAFTALASVRMLAQLTDRLAAALEGLGAAEAALRAAQPHLVSLPGPAAPSLAALGPATAARFAAAFAVPAPAPAPTVASLVTVPVLAQLVSPAAMPIPPRRGSMGAAPRDAAALAAPAADGGHRHPLIVQAPDSTGTANDAAGRDGGSGTGVASRPQPTFARLHRQTTEGSFAEAVGGGSGEGPEGAPTAIDDASAGAPSVGMDVI